MKREANFRFGFVQMGKWKTRTSRRGVVVKIYFEKGLQSCRMEIPGFYYGEKRV